MKKQTITWTAIPHGLHGPFSTDGKLRVTVFVSPRLQENGAPTLNDFPDWLHWPETVAHVKFKVHFAGGPTVNAQVVSDKPDMDLWQALFTPQTPITPFKFEDRTNQFIRSFPASRIQNDIQARYNSIIQAVAKSPGHLPNIRTLYQTFGPIVPGKFRGTATDSLLTEAIYTQLKQHKAIPPGEQPGGVAGDYHQVDLFMHRKTPQPYTADPSTHPPRPKKSDLYNLFDFHKMVSALGNYPELLVKLGLVVELEIPFDPSIPSGGAATTVSVVASKFNGPPNVRPQTHYLLDKAYGFRARPQPGSYMSNELLLRLSDKKSFDITQMDIDGTPVKLLGMMANVMEHVARPTAGLSMDQGVPSLRSAGISLIHTGRAYDLAQRFQAAATHNTAAVTNAPVQFYADDLVRGYAVDIWDKLTDKWHSISLRNGTFTFKHAPAGKQKQTSTGEGFVAMATSQVPGGSPSDLYLHEQVFRWHGWSLAAARPVTPIDTGNSGAPGDTGEQPRTPADLNNPDVTRYGLSVDFKVPKGTLPKLRFGHYYKARSRMVDIAGHSIDPSAPGALLPAVHTSPIFYARWEPLAAPAIALRHSIKGSPGESMARMVIRSDFDRSVDQYFADQSSPTYNKDAERHFLPPKTSEMMAETHGMFDNPPPAGKSWYQVITDTDVNLPMEPKPPYQPLPHNTDHLTLPYMPDPIGEGTTFVGLPGYPAGKAFTDPSWGGHWPYLGTFRMLLKGIKETATPNPPKWEHSPSPLLTVELPKGELVVVRYSSRPVSSAIALLAIWDWIVAAGFGNVFLKPVQEGLAWLLTPFHEITLVHAVQRPLIKPRFSHALNAVRQTGETNATLVDKPMHISGNSTIKIDLVGRWYEPIDDVSKPGPDVVDNHGHVSEIPINYGDKYLMFPHDAATTVDVDEKFLTHEFSNTKYHRVAYTAVATTRYREYFPFTPDEIKAKPSLLTQSSDTGALTKPDPEHPKATSIQALPLGVIDVPSSARPASPKLLYIVPTFGHETASSSDGITTKRQGGGLRVYLERPWFSSGDGELLGVVLPPEHSFRAIRGGGILKGFYNYKTPDGSHITQWGLDPIWRSHDAPSPIAPTLGSFTNAVRTANGLSIDEQSGVAVAVAGHEVSYDPDRRLWYSDIALSGGLAYYPFVRFVLARYQPNSIANAHLSRLLLADFSQIAPDRTASVTFDSKDPQQMRIAVSGAAPYRTTNKVVVSLEQQFVGGSAADPDLGWIPVDKGSLVLQSRSVGNGTLWSGEYTLPPLPKPLPPLRLVIREYELFAGAASDFAIVAVNTGATRLVYAEILDVLLPG
ncbi:MAG: putative outer rane channel [Chloroflexi bacterium]|nr:putative outer rane channel [Chloroflexota bacterium]